MIFPHELSFYLIQNQVFYNCNGRGLDHPDLWRKVVPKVFVSLVYETKVELLAHPYGCDRGRLVHHPDSDSWSLYGTRGCQEIEESLLDHFQLRLVKHSTDFLSDSHYRTNVSDVKAVQHALKLGRVTPANELAFIRIDALPVRSFSG